MPQLLPTRELEEERGIAEVLFLSGKDTTPDLNHYLPATGPCSPLAESTALSIAVMFCLNIRDNQGSVLKHVFLPYFV